MRQLAQSSRAFGLATLARRARQQSEDSPISFATPGSRLLFSARAEAVSVPASTAAQAGAYSPTTAQHPQYFTHGSGDHLAAIPEPVLRSFTSTNNRSAALSARQDAPPAGDGPEQPRPASSFTLNPLLNDRPPAILTPASLSASPTAGLPLCDQGPGYTACAPSAAHTTSSPASAASATTPTSNASVGYNEPKDGAFNGRIVQHDGSHAVHLLVSGTSARDYSLRMVRCHARDELVFGGPGKGKGAVGAPYSPVAVGPPPAARGEDVPFTTFLYRQFRDTFSATFLPAGYPDTTGQNYVRFMCWQGVNNVAVTANSVLASTFMLYAVGLGAGSIPTAGALNWVLKDGMGQLGTLLFGKTIAHNFDVHSKTWFFLSAVMLQAAAALELLTVLVPGHFLLMGSLANTLKGLAWMAAGSTRSVFHLSFARDNNIADVTAKGTSQYIFASLVGTAGGAVMCAAVGQSGPAAASCFGLLAAAAVGSAYLAVKAIPLTTLNATRLQLLVEAFLNSISPPAPRHQNVHHGHHHHYHLHHLHRHRHHQHQRDLRFSGFDCGSDKGGGAEGNGGNATAITVVHDSGGDGVHTSRRNYRMYGGGYGRDSSGGGGGGGGGARQDEDDDDDDEDDEGEDARMGGGGGGGHGRLHRWSRRRAYRTVDRCYIGPSVHEYEMMYDDSLEPRVPTPLELSPMDPPLPYFSSSAEHLKPPITVGSHLENVVDGNANLLVMLLNTYKYAHFMVLPRRGGLHVVLHEKADPRDMVQAYLQACILRRRLRSGAALPDPDEQTAELRLELQESLAAAERLTTIFMATVEANGWTVAKIVVEARRRRARW